MRHVILSTAIISLQFVHILFGQTVPDSLYHKRLFDTAKVWGFVKYFHSEVAKGNLNWDAELLNTLTAVKNATGNQEFNDVLLSMINDAGTPTIPTVPLPELPESLAYNLDLRWLDDPVFSSQVRSALDTIKVRFRPQNNYYVGEAWAGGNATYDTDNQYYAEGSNKYDETKRLLALFRYWNIINYFYPYKNIIDQNWDQTLMEFIPKFIETKGAFPYHTLVMELSTRINDTHAFTSSTIIDSNIRGYYYLPFTLKYVENKTVITKVLGDNADIKVGDIIKRINGVDIQDVRDHFRRYVPASNPSARERDINVRIVSGVVEFIRLVLENESGEKEITIKRDISINEFFKLIENTGPKWKILNANGLKVGYVDMGRLDVNEVESIFNDLWDTDRIIFDIRNYPRGTMWYMIRFLYDEPIHIADFTVPDIKYPGTLSWSSAVVGFGDFSETYNNEIVLIFNEDTQSQAEYTVMGLEQHPKAIKVGSQTAGADGNVSKIYLPGGITTYCTGLGVFYPDRTETQGIGIVPDIEIRPTITGIRAGRDEVLEVALQQVITSVVPPGHLPEEMTLQQNYPNPFNPTTTIAFTIARPGDVTLKIYNMLGQEVKILVNRKYQPGTYSVTWNGTSNADIRVASGVYIYKLTSGRQQKIKKLVTLK